MAKTFNGGTTAYATSADFIDRCDANLLGDLVNDDGTEATTAQLATSTALSAALASASGELEAHLLAGERYSVADLQALQGNGLALLKTIVCGLAIAYIRGRRGALEPGRYWQYDQAQKWLESLRAGALIFPLAETEAAGLPESVPINPDDFRNLTPTLISNETRLFGVRRNRLFPR